MGAVFRDAVTAIRPNARVAFLGTHATRLFVEHFGRICLSALTRRLFDSPIATTAN